MKNASWSLFLLLLFLSISNGQLLAQTDKTKFTAAASSDKNTVYQFSLQQAIAFAYEHQKDILNAQIDNDVANAQVHEIVGQGLPQLTSSFDLKDYIDIPTTTFPDFITPAVYEVLFNENLLQRKNLGPVQQFPIQFGTQWNATASLNATQMIFNPSYLVGVQAAKSYRELSQKNATRTRIETYAAVAKAYFSVLVTNERLKLLDANVARLDKMKENTAALYKNGFVEKIDLDRITLTYNNIVTDRQKAMRLAELSKYLLKFQMGMGLDGNLTLTDSLDYSSLKDLTISAEKPDVSKRIEYSILQSQHRLQELNLKRYKVAYYPTISAYGAVSTTALRTQFDIFEFQTDKPWYPTTLVGATLSLNLFDGAQRESRIRQANLNLLKIENDLSKTESALAIETFNARTALQNAIDSYNTQNENLKLADEIVSMGRTKYEQGVENNIEVIEAETGLKEAQTNYYSAVYDALVAKIDLDKALGNIK